MNFSEQEGTAQAYAESGDVDVQSIDDLTAGGDGIDAESNAVATADFDQSADQENDNELTASGNIGRPGSGGAAVQRQRPGRRG